MPEQKSAVVLVSGGLDSATALALARHEGYACRALSFDYGQRHRFELESARTVAQTLGVIEHITMAIDLRAFGGSALTADIDVPRDRPAGAPGEVSADIPVTYVPARNTIFLSLALGFAEARGCADIFIGVNAIDFSGYPDCRPAFIEAFQKTANLATKMGVRGQRIRIHTPLIGLTKAQIIQRGMALGVDYGLTTSCYDPAADTGRPCGRCDACRIRAAGFADAGITDPATA